MYFIFKFKMAMFCKYTRSRSGTLALILFSIMSTVLPLTSDTSTLASAHPILTGVPSCFFRFTKNYPSPDETFRSLWIKADLDGQTSTPSSAANICLLAVAQTISTTVRGLMCKILRKIGVDPNSSFIDAFGSAALALSQRAVQRCSSSTQQNTADKTVSDVNLTSNLDDDFSALVADRMKKVAFSGCRPNTVDGLDAANELIRLLGKEIQEETDTGDPAAWIPKVISILVNQIDTEIFFEDASPQTPEPDVEVFTFADRVDPHVCIFSEMVRGLGSRASVLNLDVVKHELRHSAFAHKKKISTRSFKNGIFEKLLYFLQHSAVAGGDTPSGDPFCSGSWSDSASNTGVKAGLRPTDIIVLADAFDVFAQRNLQGLKKYYYRRMLDRPTSSVSAPEDGDDDLPQRGSLISKSKNQPSHVVVYGGEKNCFPFSHRNVSQSDFEKRSCYAYRNCPVDDRRNNYKLYPFMNGSTMLGIDICYEVLQKFGNRAPVREAGSAAESSSLEKFPFLNSGTAVGSVYALQKMFRRYGEVSAVTKELDDQAILLFLSLEQNLVDIDTQGELTLNLHGMYWPQDLHGQSPFGRVVSETKNSRHILKLETNGPLPEDEHILDWQSKTENIGSLKREIANFNRMQVSDFVISSKNGGTGGGFRIMADDDIVKPEQDLEIAVNGVKMCSERYFSSNYTDSDLNEEFNGEVAAPVAFRPVPLAHSTKIVPYLLHFNGNGKTWLEICRRGFFDRGLGWNEKKKNRCLLTDDTTATVVDVKMDYDAIFKDVLD